MDGRTIAHMTAPRMDKTRIIVVEGVGSSIATGVSAYVRRQRLPWKIIVYDEEHWKNLCLSPVPPSFDGVIGRLIYHLPAAWAVKPLPCVALQAAPHAGPQVVRIGWSDAAVGRLAARHFRRLGYRRVATVSKWNHAIRARRFAAFLAEAARLGMETIRLLPPDGSPPAQAERALADALLAQPAPLGVFLHQDRDAVWFLSSCISWDVPVPARVAILGVDDTPICQSTVPAISSIVWPWEAMGTAMALQMHRLLNGLPGGGEIEIEPQRVANRASTPPVASPDPVADRIRILLDRRPQAEHRMADLARAVGLSPSQLQRRFREAYGNPVMRHLRENRCRLAQELLTTTDLDLAAIARRCGLSDAGHLWRMFQRAGLLAPMAYRRIRTTPRSEAPPH